MTSDHSRVTAKLTIRRMEDIINTIKKNIRDEEWDYVMKYSCVLEKANNDLYEVAKEAMEKQEHETI